MNRVKRKRSQGDNQSFSVRYVCTIGCDGPFYLLWGACFCTKNMGKTIKKVTVWPPKTPGRNRSNRSLKMKPCECDLWHWLRGDYASDEQEMLKQIFVLLQNEPTWPPWEYPNEIKSSCRTSSWVSLINIIEPTLDTVCGPVQIKLSSN